MLTLYMNLNNDNKNKVKTQKLAIKQFTTKIGSKKK